MNDRSFFGATGSIPVTKEPVMRFGRYFSSVLQSSVLPRRSGGPRYDEAQRDYRDALHAQLPLAR